MGRNCSIKITVSGETLPSLTPQTSLPTETHADPSKSLSQTIKSLLPRIRNLGLSKPPQQALQQKKSGDSINLNFWLTSGKATDFLCVVQRGISNIRVNGPALDVARTLHKDLLELLQIVFGLRSNTRTVIL